MFINTIVSIITLIYSNVSLFKLHLDRFGISKSIAYRGRGGHRQWKNSATPAQTINNQSPATINNHRQRCSTIHSQGSTTDTQQSTINNKHRQIKPTINTNTRHPTSDKVEAKIHFQGHPTTILRKEVVKVFVTNLARQRPPLLYANRQPMTNNVDR
jgi:hypothetical protein